jgi:hypothetical protein
MAYKVGKTDVVIQQVKLYIEGVQVPFENITINQGIGTLPTASISVPPQAGLMDIARFYQPKVHVFFEERNDPTIDRDLSLEQIKARDKLLFTGHIQNVNYMKSKAGLGQLVITFSCVHKNNLISECLIDYTGWIKEELNVAGDGSVKDGLGNSKAAIIEALEGITAIGPENEVSIDTPEGLTSVLPERFSKYSSRYLGLPGVLLNYWNQLNRAAYFKNSTRYHEAFIKLYKPLIENGLQFFQRVGGHRVVEMDNNNGKVDPCVLLGKSAAKSIIIPPANRLFLQSAIQAEMTVSSLQNYLQATGEITNIFAIFQSFYDSVDYEMITLASPAEVILYGQDVAEQSGMTKSATDTNAIEPDDTTETSAIETIIKPKVPFYFSPTCNVIFPHMYDSVSVSYDESNIPTRIDMVNHEMPQSSAWGTHFRSPHSVRSAIAEAAASIDSEKTRSLLSTIASSYGAIGIYEQGRGVKVDYNAFPRWLSYLSNSKYSADTNASQVYPEEGSVEAQALKDLQTGWDRRYPDAKDKTMSPWSSDSGISAHHRILFASADYYFSMVFARSKAGNVSCLFNPYIVPGYPMDILEKSPVLPSFHAMCASVTHVISSNRIETNVGFVAAATYSELANYYMPFVLPALQISLGLAKNPTLVNSDPEAQQLADAFYRETLGVGAAIPEQIFDYDTGLTKPIKMDASGVWAEGSAEPQADRNGGELNPALTYEGNMSLVRRPIESRLKHEERFEIKFIDLTQENYSPTAVEYVPPIKETSQQLEIGASQFLTYNTKFGEPI